VTGERGNGVTVAEKVAIALLQATAVYLAVLIIGGLLGLMI
jgi:hypothetical protein